MLLIGASLNASAFAQEDPFIIEGLFEDYSVPEVGAAHTSSSCRALVHPVNGRGEQSSSCCMPTACPATRRALEAYRPSAPSPLPPSRVDLFELKGLCQYE